MNRKVKQLTTFESLTIEIQNGGFGIYSKMAEYILKGEVPGTPEEFIKELQQQISPPEGMKSAKESMIQTFGGEIVNKIIELTK